MLCKSKTLILDLDHTILVAEDEKHKVHTNHSLSELITGEIYLSPAILEKRFHIINPDKTAALIQEAYDCEGAVIIITSGFWTPNIRLLLAMNLMLSSSAKEQLSNCDFFNPIEEGALWKLSPYIIQGIPKGVRFIWLRTVHVEWTNRDFVFLDDSPTQVQSFHMITQVNAILATTTSPSLDFYAEVMQALSPKLQENHCYFPGFFENPYVPRFPGGGIPIDYLLNTEQTEAIVHLETVVSGPSQ